MVLLLECVVVVAFLLFAPFAGSSLLCLYCGTCSKRLQTLASHFRSHEPGEHAQQDRRRQNEPAASSGSAAAAAAAAAAGAVARTRHHHLPSAAQTYAVRSSATVQTAQTALAADGNRRS